MQILQALEGEFQVKDINEEMVSGDSRTRFVFL